MINVYSGLPFDESLYKSEKKVEDGEIVTLLKQSTNPRANKKKKKAAEKAVSEETKADDAPMLVESWLNKECKKNFPSEWMTIS